MLFQHNIIPKHTYERILIWPLPDINKMDRNRQYKEINKTFKRCAKKFQKQVKMLDHQFLKLHEHLHDIENKTIGNILDNSKNLLKNLHTNHVGLPSGKRELKQNVHSLILNCEIACTYAKVMDLEEKTKGLHEILEDKKLQEKENQFQ
jgi:hypothetical protein